MTGERIEDELEAAHKRGDVVRVAQLADELGPVALIDHLAGAEEGCMPAAWLVTNAPDEVIVYVAKLVRERDTAVEEYGELEILADGYSKRSTRLTDTLGALVDVTAKCSGCRSSVGAIMLGLERSL